MKKIKSIIASIKKYIADSVEENYVSLPSHF